jgi:simple sugar transport system permease protein
LRAAIGSAIPTVVSSVGAVAIALLAGAVVIILSGQDPILAYQAMFVGAFGGTREIAETLVAATPLIFGGLAFAIAYQAGMFNIGIEGQLVLGGLAAGLVAAAPLGLPLVIHLPLALLAAVVAGGFWGFVPGLLKAGTGAHEVITTIMLNYIAYRISAYVIANNTIFPMVNPALQATNPAVPEARLPRFIEDTRLHGGLILALIAAVILWYVLYRTTFGYRVRMVGISRGAAAYAGVSWGRTITIAMLISGVLGGLAGASEALGLQGRYFNIAPGYGFTAIAVGLVGRNHPAGVVLAGLLFGALNAGATRMQSAAGTSKDLVSVLLGLVILSVAAFSAIDYIQRRRQQAARARGSTRDRASADAGEPDVPSPAQPPAI